MIGELLPDLLALIIQVVLLYSLYRSYQIIQNMREDLDYATARIFLSSESIKGIKVLMAILVVYGFFNALVVFTLSGFWLDVVGRINLLYLFIGWAYFLTKIQVITSKPE